MIRKITIHREGDILTLEWSRWGRAVSGWYRGIKLFPWVMGGFTVFFMADYLCRYAEEEPLPGLFWGSLVALSLLISSLAAVVRYFRRDRWIFDGEDRVVVAEVGSLRGKPARGEEDLREVEAVLLVENGWPGTSAVALRFGSGAEERLFAGHGMSSEMEAAAGEIREFLREQRYHVDLLRNDEISDEA